MYAISDNGFVWLVILMQVWRGCHLSQRVTIIGLGEVTRYIM